MSVASAPAAVFVNSDVSGGRWTPTLGTQLEETVCISEVYGARNIKSAAPVATNKI